MKETLKKREINIVLLIFIILPFFKPDIIVSYPKLNNISYVYLTLSFLFILVEYIKKKKLSKFLLVYILFAITILFSTIYNDGNIFKACFDLLQQIGIIMAVELYCNGNIMKLLKALVIVFFALTIVNTFSFLIFPYGLSITEITNTPIYFLGIDNRFSFVYLPGLCIISIFDLIKNNKITFITYLYLAITYITFIYFWSAGALLAETLLVVFYLFFYKKINIKPTIYYYINIVSFISLVYFRIQNIFKFIIVDILHKDLTLSSRTLLWDKSILLIKEHPVLGIGIQKSSTMLQKISAYHSHNHFLNVFLQSGIVGLSLYLVLIYLSFKKLADYKNEIISKIISFTIFTILIMLLADTFDITCNLILLIALGYNVEKIITWRNNYV